MRGEAIAEIAGSLIIAMLTGLYAFGGLVLGGLCLPHLASAHEGARAGLPVVRHGELTDLRDVESRDGAPVDELVRLPGAGRAKDHRIALNPSWRI